jgi:kynureninase
MTFTRSEAEALDRTDPLARFRERFDIDDRYAAYMDGNSLGRPPRVAGEVLTATLGTWTDSMILGWRDWIRLPMRLGDRIAQDVIGAEAGEVLVSDSTTVNLYKAAMAAVDAVPGRTRIITSDDNFPTDIYVLESVARRSGGELVVLAADEVDGLDPELLQRSVDDRTALVALSHVAYKSGALLDLASVSRLVHDAGAMMLWDLSHSAGSVPMAMRELPPVVAVGCTYKYLNGGPGCPAFTYVPHALQGRLRQPIWGWFGHRDQFQMRTDYDPADGIEQFLTGAPTVLSLVTLEAGLESIAEAGVAALYAKSQRLTDLLIAGVDGIGSDALGIASPRDPAARGAHVTVRHGRAKDVVRGLIAAGVIPDYRPPDLIRFGPAPLYTRFVDVLEAVERLAEVSDAVGAG